MFFSVVNTLLATNSKIMCLHRCKHSEGRYGKPVSCDHCQMKCAFIKQDQVKQKVRSCNQPPLTHHLQVDGMTLCLMCTLRYKKTRHQLTSSDYDIISSRWLPVYSSTCCQSNICREKPPANKKQRLSATTTTRLSTTTTITATQSSHDIVTTSLPVTR